MPAVSAHAPGPLYRWALEVYGRLPRRVRLFLLHLLAPSHTVGALCFVEHDDRVLMLGQRHRRGWTLPGGLLDRGENAEQAVVREVREETGLSVRVGLPIGVVVDARSRRVDVLFHVRAEREHPVTAGSEATQARWLTREQAGPVDDPTAQAFAVLDAAGRAGAHLGVVLDDDAGHRAG
jgi:8-oxo-dGTP diphosphatase